MKAYVKIALPGYTGNTDDMVIYYNSTLNCLIARKKVIPKFTPNNKDVQEIFALAKRLVLSPGFMKDCREYIRLYNRHFRRKHRSLSSWPAVWMKLMRNLVRLYPSLDLASLTREDIVNNALPCGSIAAAVQARCLESVPGASTLTNPM